MALTQCKECGHDVSTTASMCPNCGAPDFLSDEMKKKVRKESQREQIRNLVKNKGTELTADQLLGKSSEDSPKVQAIMQVEKKETNERKNKAISTTVAIGCLTPIVIIVAIFIWVMMASLGDNEESKPSTTTLKLKASARFTGIQFVIANNDSFDWVNVKMEINAGLLRGGYALEHPIIKAGETYTVGVLQFAKSDGTRFNPVAMKVQKFVIRTFNSDGKIKGSWHGEFK